MTTDVKESYVLKAQTPLQAVYEAPDSPTLLRRTLTGIVTWQQRNEITVERALRSPNLAPQWVAALLALGASATFLDGPERPLADFLRRRGEQRGKLAAVHLPLNVPGRTWGESHVARTPADPPIVAAVAVVDWDASSTGTSWAEPRGSGQGGVVRQVRLALTGVWRTPAQLAESAGVLVGGPLYDEQIERVASWVQQEIAPPDNFLGSANYRREMAAVMVRRALEACKKGANQWLKTG